MGTTTHCSLLLHRLRAAGLNTPARLVAAALRRGLSYYGAATESEMPASGHHPVTDAELAIALLHPSLPWDPHRLRLAAAILASPGIHPEKIARLAVQERAVALVREIAAAGASAEPNVAFWDELLRALPERPPVPRGVLPHPSRYMAISGRARPGCAPPAVWIRPMQAA